jgi:vacuolar-type H+-ATPase subunit F/Vma7
LVIVIGDEDTVLGFQLLGFNRNFIPKNDDELRKFIDGLIGEKDIVIIIEKMFESANVLLKEKKFPYPIIIPIPDKHGSMMKHESRDIIKEIMGV